MLSETSIGGASIAGLEKAVKLLDTLGSSMSSLNTGSGFITGVVHRGNKISILAFEVANTIAKAATLWKSLSDESIRILKEDVLKSDGVRLLVSSDEKELLCIAAADKSAGICLETQTEMEASVHQLSDLAHNTSELYHELHALDRFEEDYHRKFHEEKTLRDACPLVSSV